MKTYYWIRPKSYYSGAFELKPNKPYVEVEDFLYPDNNKRFPEDVVFTVKKGKRAFDLIFYYECVNHEFYSEKFIRLISEFIDMSDKCQALKIDNYDGKYYVLKNLPSVNRFKRCHPFYLHNDEPEIFYEEGEVPPIFILKGSYMVIVNEEVKNAIEKAKLKNIIFEKCFQFSKEEYDAYNKYWNKIGQFIDRY